jgi:lysine-specific demethylase/histidyl-hydroxylase NO66
VQGAAQPSFKNPKRETREFPLLDTSRTRFAALRGLLGSASGVEQFFERYWERTPLLVRDARWPGNLLSQDRIEDLVSFRRHGTDIVLARASFDTKAGREVYSARNSTDAGEIGQAWQDGSTIIITALHQRDARVAMLIQQLELDFQHGVGANLYFTPAGNQGFKTHTDDHDVFVLQLHGRKFWTVYDFEDAARRVTGRHAPAFPMQFVLEQGQALYIPKGYPHYAAAVEGSSSTHLTVGLYPFQLNDLVSRSLIEIARDDPALRLSLSPAGGNPARQLPADAIAKIFEGRYLIRARMAMTKDFLRRAKPFIPGRFSHRLSAIGPDTCLRSRFFGLTLVESCGERVSIHFPGNFVAGPAAIETALRFVTEHERLCPRDLPDELSDSSKIVLVQRLAREGLLEFDQREDGNG